MVYRMGKIQEMGQYPECDFLDGDCMNIQFKAPLTPEMQSAALRSRAHLFNLGYPIEAANVPTMWQWASARTLPDYYTPEGFPCVSPRLKEIIERYEPDVHQFFPLKVVNDKNEPIAEHYLWVVCNLIDSVNREHTTMILRNGRTWTSEELIDGKLVRVVENPKLTISRKQTEGIHFWCDPFLRRGVIYASDDAGQAMLDAGLTALSLNYVETA